MARYGKRINEADEVSLARLPVVVVETIYSNFALPLVEVKLAGNPSRHMWKLNGILRTRVALPGFKRNGQSFEFTVNSHAVPSTYTGLVTEQKLTGKEAGWGSTMLDCHEAIASLPRFHFGRVDLRKSGCWKEKRPWTLNLHR
jgi:hypothetical protein